MRVPFVLVDTPLAGCAPGDEVPLTSDQLHHLGRVLRRRDGDDLEIGDGVGGTAEAELRDGRARVRGAVVDHAPPTPSFTVVHALPKGRGFDEVVRVLTELGVQRIAPVLTARTESRPDAERAARATERWRQISRAATEQSRRPHLCEVATPIDLDVEASSSPTDEIAVVADPAAGAALGDVLRAGELPERVRIAVGPEGGFTPEEVAALDEQGWVPARAGDTVLRSVHAASVLVAAAMALTGHFSTA